MKDTGLNGKKWTSNNIKRVPKTIERFKFEAKKKRRYSKRISLDKLDEQIEQLRYLIKNNLK